MKDKNHLGRVELRNEMKRLNYGAIRYIWTQFEMSHEELYCAKWDSAICTRPYNKVALEYGDWFNETKRFGIYIDDAREYIHAPYGLVRRVAEELVRRGSIELYSCLFDDNDNPTPAFVNQVRKALEIINKENQQ